MLVFKFYYHQETSFLFVTYFLVVYFSHRDFQNSGNSNVKNTITIIWLNVVENFRYFQVKNTPLFYVVSHNLILLFSILDQQQKQSIPFEGGVWLGEYEGRVYVSTASDVYTLVCVPIEKQVS